MEKRKSVISMAHSWRMMQIWQALCMSDGDACKLVSLENFKSQRLGENIIIMCKACERHGASVGVRTYLLECCKYFYLARFSEVCIHLLTF
jgi:hypothetical protein